MIERVYEACLDAFAGLIFPVAFFAIIWLLVQNAG